MKQKYIIRKIKRFSGLGDFFWLLYRHEPEADTCQLVGRFGTLGQLLCSIGCDEIENWKFVSQATSPGGHVSVTCYSYSKMMGGCNVEIAVDVVEKSATGWSQDEEDGPIMCKLSPDELHKILFLLHGKRVEIQNDLGDPNKPVDTRSLISQIDEVAFLDRLSGKLNLKMRKWLEKHPDEADELLHENGKTVS